MKKVVFLDRDGTINKEVGYLHKKEDFEFIPRAEEAIHLLNKNGYMVVVVTNQAGVAKGLYKEEDVWSLHQYIQWKLKKSGAWIDEFFYCPYHRDGIIDAYKKDSVCRKPGTGMLDALEDKIRIDKENSWMIGDTKSDMLAGHNFGIRTILVSTGYGRETYKKGSCQNDYYVKDILAAVKLILTDS